MPPDVECAKKICCVMTERADIGEGENLDDASCTIDLLTLRSIDSEGDPGIGIDSFSVSDAMGETKEARPTSFTVSRPLVDKRATKESSLYLTSDLISSYKLHMMQDKARSAKEVKDRALACEAEQQWRMEQRGES